MDTPYSQLQQLTGLPPEAPEWLNFVTRVLKLDGCYLPAAQAAISQNRWRQLPGQPNLFGYIKTATVREAHKMGLGLDRFRPTEHIHGVDFMPPPRVQTKDQPRSSPNSPARGTVGLVLLPSIPDGVSYQDHLDRLLEKACQRESRPNDLTRQVPRWLRRADERDAVDWEKVAKYAVLKPHMAAAVAEVLWLQARGLSRERALANASNQKKARKLQNAWRWVDGNWSTRIAPLFRLEEPPAVSTPTRHSGFVKPADALGRALVRNQKVTPASFIAPKSRPIDRLRNRLQKFWGCPVRVLSLGARFLHVEVPGRGNFVLDATDASKLERLVLD